jgi:hypothetical protein
MSEEYIFNGFKIDPKSWLDKPRSQLTVKIDKKSLDEFKKLMKCLNRPCTLGFDCLISLLDDEDNMKTFIEKVRNS